MNNVNKVTTVTTVATVTTVYTVTTETTITTVQFPLPISSGATAYGHQTFLTFRLH